ncbi:hypothetical protein [Microbacterium capsulatum]|uniref:Uncharacterized protein n=1 Tax=Microbacterium capsulatum TaxID=3041921 RepID=A0ABU0XE65_9MICO|nr:hypothetical protein [Microbacterium sp. ASV81]MDQ4212475.1 hypothetical protein [Microbacterium sp. ASV81]
MRAVLDPMTSEGRPSAAPTGRRLFAVAGVLVSLVVSGSYWLASTGGSSPAISPPAGAPASGEVAEVTPLSSTVTRPNGGALLQSGVALAKLQMSYQMANAIRVDVSWTNAVHAAQVLNNPNAFISTGLYHAIHTGSCVNATAGSVAAPLVNVTDTDSVVYCAALDQGTTGMVDSAGKLLLGGSQVNGYLAPAMAGSNALSACAAAPGSPTLAQEEAQAACQPASASNASQNTLFVIASIVTPGGIPQGQQASLSSLTFYVRASVSG